MSQNYTKISVKV